EYLRRDDVSGHGAQGFGTGFHALAPRPLTTHSGCGYHGCRDNSVGALSSRSRQQLEPRALGAALWSLWCPRGAGGARRLAITFSSGSARARMSSATAAMSLMSTVGMPASGKLAS